MTYKEGHGSGEINPEDRDPEVEGGQPWKFLDPKGKEEKGSGSKGSNRVSQ